MISTRCPSHNQDPNLYFLGEKGVGICQQSHYFTHGWGLPSEVERYRGNRDTSCHGGRWNMMKYVQIWIMAYEIYWNEIYWHLVKYGLMCGCSCFDIEWFGHQTDPTCIQHWSNLDPHHSFTHTFVTHNFVTHNYFTHNIVSHNCFTHNCHAHTICHTQLFPTHTHTTLSRTTLPLPHAFLSHSHTHNAWRRGILRGGRGIWWLWWCFCVAHVAFGDIDAALVWQPWHLVTVALLLRGRRGTYLTCICLVDLLFFCFVFLQSQGDGRGNQKRESKVILKEVNEKTIYIYYMHMCYKYYIYI
jgi:hypothetical protein